MDGAPYVCMYASKGTRGKNNTDAWDRSQATVGAGKRGFAFPAMLADEGFASPEPSASSVDEDFWRHVDMVFADLTVEDGEEAGNAWWIQRPAGSTEAKMVLRAPSPAGRNLVRSLRAVLSEHESPMVGAKLLVNSDLLVVVYLRSGTDFDVEFLEHVAESCEATAFVPWDSMAPQAHLLWMGNSNESDSLCVPVY